MKMRILVISNFFPPYYIGGYELGCRDIVEGLKSRGHEVAVLTSKFGLEKAYVDGNVYRWLDAEIFWKVKGSWHYYLKLLRKEINNQNKFKKLCKIFVPEIVYLWNLANISVSIPIIAADMGITSCYYVFDSWLSKWESDPWYSLWKLRKVKPGRRLFKAGLYHFLKLLGFITSGTLDLSHVQFASNYLKEEALRTLKGVEDAGVIHWGIDTKYFSFKATARKPERLLYAGQIVAHKGVHTVIEAMRILVKEYGYNSLILTIAGGTTVPDYLRYIKDLVHKYDLDKNVSFSGLVPREKMNLIYREHDILIFPSIWDEPFGITLLEAMSCGLAVVATATGGSTEILDHGFNALVFEKGDAYACARNIMLLLKEEELFEMLRRNGRRTVEERFTFEVMLNRIEQSLIRARKGI